MMFVKREAGILVIYNVFKKSVHKQELSPYRSEKNERVEITRRNLVTAVDSILNKGSQCPNCEFENVCKTVSIFAQIL